MAGRVEVHFESVEVRSQQVFGKSGDFIESVVHFSFRYPDGHVHTNCQAGVWHAIKGPNESLVHVTVPAAYQCPAYGHALELAIESY